MISNSLPLKLTANTIQIPPITEKNSPHCSKKQKPPILSLLTGI